MVLAEGACVSPAIPIAREQLFNPPDEICSRDVQSVREFQNRRKRWAVFTALKKANVLRMITALECQGFLR